MSAKLKIVMLRKAARFWKILHALWFPDIKSLLIIWPVIFFMMLKLAFDWNLIAIPSKEQKLCENIFYKNWQEKCGLKTLDLV